MIGYLYGEITDLFSDYCLLNVHDVGYRVFISATTRNRLRLGEKVKLRTYTAVREDAILLYGFLSQEEQELFLELINVSSIGAKTALGILSAITVEDFCKAICQKQVKDLIKLPGVGKKSAERLILELKDRLSYDQTDGEPAIEIDSSVMGDDPLNEATAALLALGYHPAEITPALKKAKKKENVEEIIKFALKELSKI